MTKGVYKLLSVLYYSKLVTRKSIVSASKSLFIYLFAGFFFVLLEIEHSASLLLGKLSSTWVKEKFLSCFWDGVLLIAGDGLKPRSFCLCLSSSWDYRHVSPFLEASKSLLNALYTKMGCDKDGDHNIISESPYQLTAGTNVGK
jgi:hypothetical protein